MHTLQDLLLHVSEDARSIALYEEVLPSREVQLQIGHAQVLPLAKDGRQVAAEAVPMHVLVHFRGPSAECG